MGFFELGGDGPGGGIDKLFSQALNLGTDIARQKLAPLAFGSPQAATAGKQNGQPAPLFAMEQRLAIDDSTKKWLMYGGAATIGVILFLKMRR